MLRHNIDVTVGTVHGTFSTVIGIYAIRISIKFDHIDVPCDIKSGLSLNTAIINLSIDVFGDGMAYVALSRVRTLNGLHLLSFDPLSVKVSNPCINEINRLKTKFLNNFRKSRKVKE
uniref:Uncharacterized protein n=1 Tax=Amphimedon queenslandica TaxID=400682 RepID=A0A1X7TWI6_AMPQE